MTSWQTEAEEKSFGRADWDTLSIAERVTKTKESGLDGKLGSKSWEDLTPRERATIIDPEKRPMMLDFRVKAHVALEDSDRERWGMVKYLKPGNYKLEAMEGELVGNWSLSPGDGLIHVFLETPLEALADRAVQEFAKYAEARRITAAVPKVTRARTRKTPVPAPEPSEELTTISNLRKLLSK